MTQGAFCKAASSHKIPNMIRNNPIESPGNCWENNPIICPLCPACCHAPGVSAVSMACRVAEVKANIHPVPSPFRVIGHNRIVVSLLATRVWISMGNGAGCIAPGSCLVLNFIDAAARKTMHPRDSACVCAPADSMLPLDPDHVQQLSQHLLRRKILLGYCGSICTRPLIIRLDAANRVSRFCSRPEGMQSRTQGEDIAKPRILEDGWPTSRQITGGTIAKPAAPQTYVQVFHYGEFTTRTTHIVPIAPGVRRHLQRINDLPAMGGKQLEIASDTLDVHSHSKCCGSLGWQIETPHPRRTLLPLQGLPVVPQLWPLGIPLANGGIDPPWAAHMRPQVKDNGLACGVPRITAGWHGGTWRANVLPKRKYVRMVIEESAQILITIGQSDVGGDRVEIDIDGWTSSTSLGENVVDPAEIDQQVGLPHEHLEMSCTRAVFHLTRRVKESPALTEAKPLQKPHQIAGQHNRPAARCPPSILHLDAS